MSDLNDLTENEVVKVVSDWLQRIGYTMLKDPCFDTAKGDDISATSPDGSELYVECKGSISKKGNMLSDWVSSAMAVFGAIVETAHKRPKHIHAIAVPATEPYKRTLEPLRDFFIKQDITLIWVNKDGTVSVDGAQKIKTPESF